MGFFGFLWSLIVFLIKTPILITFSLVKLIFHPISILVALIALYLYYTSSENKKDIPFVTKLAPSFKPPGNPNGTKSTTAGIQNSKAGKKK